MNFRKLRGRIVEKYGSVLRFSRILGISNVSVYNKLSARTDFSRSDILKWANLLNIPTRSIGEYFFTENVENSHQ